MFEKEAEEYTNFVKSTKERWNCDKIFYADVELAYQKGAEFGYKKANEWHYDEPTESKNNFYVILKNGNHRICYWDLISKADKCLKNVVNGEHIAFNFIRCWKEIVLPKEIDK